MKLTEAAGGIGHADRLILLPREDEANAHAAST